MTARGFTLVELLIATVVLLTISAAAAAVSTPLRDAFERTLSAGDAVTRTRSALEMIAVDIRQAGTGMSDVEAVVVPLASLERADMMSPFTAISVSRVPQYPGRGLLRNPAGAGTTTLELDNSASCAGSDNSCGFSVGDRAAIVDGARLERVEVGAVDAASSRLTLASGLQTSFSVGAMVVAIETNTYGLRSDPTGMRLIRRRTGGSEQTLIDYIVRLEFTLLGAAAPPLPGVDDDQPPTYGPFPPLTSVDDVRDAWPPGQNCTIAIQDDGARVPRLPPLDTGEALVPLAAEDLLNGPWCPDAATSARFDADLLRVRAVELSIITEVASAQLRGPASLLFGDGGTGTRATQWVPDTAVRTTVMLRSRR